MENSSSSLIGEETELYTANTQGSETTGLNSYEILGEVGKGGQGQVLKVKKKDAILTTKNANVELILKKRICLTIEEANEALQEVDCIAS